MKSTLWMTVTFLAAIGSAASAFAADSPSEVLRSYKSSHEAKSVERVGKLVQFRTQDQSHRASWFNDVTATFSSKIANINLIPFQEFAFMLPESELAQLPATLKPANWLVVEFVSQSSDSGRTQTTNYLVAVQNGKYFIVGP